MRFLEFGLEILRFRYNPTRRGGTLGQTGGSGSGASGMGAPRVGMGGPTGAAKPKLRRRRHPTRRGGPLSDAYSGTNPRADSGGSVDEDEDETTDVSQEQRDAYATIQLWLKQWGLEGLASWAWEKIQDGDSVDAVLRELYEHPVFKRQFPENDLRKAKDPNFRWMSPAEILAYRSDASSIGRRLGLNLSLGSIQGFMANDRSLAEFEETMKDYFSFLNYGDVVKNVFEQRLGHQIDDPTAFAILSNEIPTPDLDRMFDEAIFMGQPTILGLQIRPIEEVRRLMAAGYTPASGFEVYKQVASSLPDIERLSHIDRAIAQDDSPYDSFATALGAFSGLDVTAQRELGSLFAREVARNSSGGATGFQGTRATALELPR